jgi:hypothetical protein
LLFVTHSIEEALVDLGPHAARVCRQQGDAVAHVSREPTKRGPGLPTKSASAHAQSSVRTGAAPA